MADYIDREAAIARVKKQMNRELTFGPWAWNDRIAKVCYGIVIEALERLPSADVKPVTKSEWVYRGREEVFDISGVRTWGARYQCLNCGFEPIFIEDNGRYDFCPNCNADMRGETE